MSVLSQYVTLGVADDLFAAPVERVHEILEPRSISRLPNAPKVLLGIIDVRGQNVPVIDLRICLGLEPVTETGTTRIMVLSVHAPDGEKIIGLKTDRVYEVTVLDSEELDPAPDMIGGRNALSISGIGRKNGRFVTVLDVDALFGALPVAPGLQDVAGVQPAIAASGAQA